MTTGNRNGQKGGNSRSAARAARIRRLRIRFALVAALLLTAAACDAGNASGTPGGAGHADLNDRTETEQDDAANGRGATENGPGNPAHGRGLPVTPPEDGTDEPLDEQFVSLAETGAPVADLLAFIRTFAGQASEGELSAMLLILEEKQWEQGYALEDRYYEDPAIQETLFEWYVEHRRLPRAADLPDGPAKRLLADAEAGGYKTETAEGVFFPVIDYAVYKTFRARATEDVQAYFALMAKEADEPAVKDGALIIPWEEAARRALAFEAFVAAYPDSVRAGTAERLLMDYTYISFQGIDHSPLFEREGGPVVGAVLKAYKRVLAERDKKAGNGKKGNGEQGGTAGAPAADSRYLANLREFVRLVEAGGGRQTAEVRAFQERVTEGLLDEYDKRYGGNGG